ncbi:MAG: low molecular weight phosphotyrosine protein phosphatase [Flavobacteriaceae bacterium]|nr:low molecular weight phosphotyrosine protein phosphatase [Flavobacteriaceae bacterium]
MKKILMVCLGNICRSPLAEGILKSKVDTSKVYVDSAGTSAFHQGALPDARSIAIAKKYGIDITDQRSRPFEMYDFDEFDIIYTMDTSNYNNILELARDEEDTSKVKMILGRGNDVPDPYYGGEHGFKNVYLMLDEACERIATTLQNEK